jgi:hypothetical protein
LDLSASAWAFTYGNLCFLRVDAAAGFVDQGVDLGRRHRRRYRLGQHGDVVQFGIDYCNVFRAKTTVELLFNFGVLPDKFSDLVPSKKLNGKEAFGSIFLIDGLNRQLRSA